MTDLGHFPMPAYPDTCMNYSSCDLCSYHADKCGFCYFKNSSMIQGQCLPLLNISDYEDTFSNFGACSPVNTTDMSKSSSIYLPDAIFAKGWCPTNISWLPILGMVIYLCSFSIGFGPVPWTLNSEIYPQWARSTGNSVATSVNWLCNLVVSLTFLILVNAITRQGAFFLYCGLSVIGLVIFYFIVPETKNRSLEELENLFNEPWFGKSSPTSMRTRLSDFTPSSNYHTLQNPEKGDDGKF